MLWLIGVKPVVAPVFGLVVPGVLLAAALTFMRHQDSADVVISGAVLAAHPDVVFFGMMLGGYVIAMIPSPSRPRSDGSASISAR